MRIATLTLLAAIANNAMADLPQSISHKKGAFQLCAEERVSKLWFDIVDVGVYYPNCDSAEHIFDNQTKLLRFSYLREVEGQQFTEGADEYLHENLNSDVLAMCSEPFRAINSVYKDVSAGDYYDLFLFQDEGLKLYLNDKHLHDMTNTDCHSKYLNVWFGKETMDSQFNDLAKKIKTLAK